METALWYTKHLDETKGPSFLPPADRNKEAILDVFKTVLPLARGGDGKCTILGTADGSGQHVAHFAAGLPCDIEWWPSDLDVVEGLENKWGSADSIAHYCREAGVTNVQPRMCIDVGQRGWWADLDTPGFDMVYNINCIHIAPWEVCLGLLDGASHVLKEGGLLLMYGPYKEDGACSESNTRFDEKLRELNPSWGLRDVSDVSAEAKSRGFVLRHRVEMPANNLTLVFQKDSSI